MKPSSISVLYEPSERPVSHVKKAMELDIKAGGPHRSLLSQRYPWLIGRAPLGTETVTGNVGNWRVSKGSTTAQIGTRDAVCPPRKALNN